MSKKATNFQEKVWEALRLIPCGKVTTYKAVADFLQTKAVRAVGTAAGKNPYAPDIPCHRIVLSDGKVGNYSDVRGVDKKIELLASEGVFVKDSKIVDFKEKLFIYPEIQ